MFCSGIGFALFFQLNPELCLSVTESNIVKLAYLVEATALIAAHSKMIVEGSDSLPTVKMGDYYIHSRNRFNRWMRDLNDMTADVAIRDPLHQFGLHPRFPVIMSITEQILVNGLLNRIWTLTLLAVDRHRREDAVTSLALNVSRSFDTIRQKAFNLARQHDSVSPAQVLHLNRMQCSADRWADLMTCSLMAEYDLWDYAVDSDRCREFHRDRFQSQQLNSEDSRSWSLILAGLKHSFPDKGGLSYPIHDDDRLILKSLIDCFPAERGSLKAWPAPEPQKSKAV